MLQQLDVLAKGEAVRVGYMEKLQLVKKDWDKATLRKTNDDHNIECWMPGPETRWADLDSTDDCDGVGDASSRGRL